MTFTGTHILGRGRARTLGFPTINLHGINTVIMEDGVYAARVTIDAIRYKAAMFIGESPTFKDKEKSVELYLIGLTEEEIKKIQLTPIIPSKISVETVQYIRPVIKFPTRKELITQIETDIKQISEILDGKPVNT